MDGDRASNPVQVKLTLRYMSKLLPKTKLSGKTDLFQFNYERFDDEQSPYRTFSYFPSRGEMNMKRAKRQKKGTTK